MSRFLCAAAALFLAACADAPEDDPENLIPAQIIDVRDYGEKGVAILLKGEKSTVVPIMIGHCEANALMSAMRKQEFPRPLTYDLLEVLLEKMKGEVRRLVIHSLKEQVFHAHLHIDTREGSFLLDCRPSDGMVIVTRLGAPIYLTPELVEQADKSPRA